MHKFKFQVKHTQHTTQRSLQHYNNTTMTPLRSFLLALMLAAQRDNTLARLGGGGADGRSLPSLSSRPTNNNSNSNNNARKLLQNYPDIASMFVPVQAADPNAKPAPPPTPASPPASPPAADGAPDVAVEPNGSNAIDPALGSVLVANSSMDVPSQSPPQSQAPSPAPSIYDDDKSRDQTYHNGAYPDIASGFVPIGNNNP